MGLPGGACLPLTTVTGCLPGNYEPTRGDRELTDPLYAVCELTTPDTSFEEDLALYGETGAKGIGICEWKLLGHDLDSALRAFERRGVMASSCIGTHVSPLPSDPWFPGPDNPNERIEKMCSSIHQLSSFDPATIVVLTGSGRGRPYADARAIAVEGLREAALFAKGLDVTLSLEPIRRSFGMDLSIVETFAEALDLLDDVGAENLKIMYDAHHLWDSEDILVLTRKHADAIGGVQVSDWRSPTRSSQDRVLPGDGVIDLPSIFEALIDGGFDGWYDLEVFSDDGRNGNEFSDSLWKLPPRTLLERGRLNFLRCWGLVKRGREGDDC
jgi:sugar phosphate isomerase/epimerase